MGYYPVIGAIANGDQLFGSRIVWKYLHRAGRDIAIAAIQGHIHFIIVQAVLVARAIM